MMSCPMKQLVLERSERDTVSGSVGQDSDAAYFAVLLEYGRSLEDDICSDTSFMFQRVLVSLSAVSHAPYWLLLLGVLLGCSLCSLFQSFSPFQPPKCEYSPGDSLGPLLLIISPVDTLASHIYPLF